RRALRVPRPGDLLAHAIRHRRIEVLERRLRASHQVARDVPQCHDRPQAGRKVRLTVTYVESAAARSSLVVEEGSMRILVLAALAAFVHAGASAQAQVVSNTPN